MNPAQTMEIGRTLDEEPVRSLTDPELAERTKELRREYERINTIIWDSETGVLRKEVYPNIAEKHNDLQPVFGGTEPTRRFFDFFSAAREVVREAAGVKQFTTIVYPAIGNDILVPLIFANSPGTKEARILSFDFGPLFENNPYRMGRFEYILPRSIAEKLTDSYEQSGLAPTGALAQRDYYLASLALYGIVPETLRMVSETALKIEVPHREDPYVRVSTVQFEVENSTRCLISHTHVSGRYLDDFLDKQDPINEFVRSQTGWVNERKGEETLLLSKAGYFSGASAFALPILPDRTTVLIDNDIERKYFLDEVTRNGDHYDDLVTEEVRRQLSEIDGGYTKPKGWEPQMQLGFGYNSLTDVHMLRLNRKQPNESDKME